MAKIPPYPTSLVFRRRGINTIFSFYILTQIYIIRKTSNRVNGFLKNNLKKFVSALWHVHIIYRFSYLVNIKFILCSRLKIAALSDRAAILIKHIQPIFLIFSSERIGD